MHKNIIKEIIALKQKGTDETLSRFFKTGPGQYSEGDLFLGITVPVCRTIATKHNDIELKEVAELIKNKYHEVRLIALLILVQKYKKAKTESAKKKIYDFYFKNIKYINNWDLVDLSAHYIVGDYLINKNPRLDEASFKILEKLAKSNNLWERRIAIVSTFASIYKGKPEWTFKITKILLFDSHDLIHKACGWMLREVGKRVSVEQLTSYLDINGPQMPRTMLRYAIERLPEKKRLYYLHK